MSKKRDKKKDRLSRCGGVRCGNCGSTDVFWQRLSQFIEGPEVALFSDRHIRWCWTCGNRKLTNFLVLFTGEPVSLKKAIRRM